MLRVRAADARRLFVLSRAQAFILPVLRMLLLSRIMVVALLKEGGCEVEKWQDIQTQFASCVTVARRS